MQVSAEARLWWQRGRQSDVEAWFDGMSAIAPGGAGSICNATSDGDPRVDVYLYEPEQTELGVKHRAVGGADERLEVKSLISVRPSVPYLGSVSLWVKLTSKGLKFNRSESVATRKERRLRKYGWSGEVLSEIALGPDERPIASSLPDQGCNVEFTRVASDMSDEVWWTLGYEAFGTLGAVETILRTCIALTVNNPIPRCAEATSASYPEWLSRLPHAARQAE